MGQRDPNHELKTQLRARGLSEELINELLIRPAGQRDPDAARKHVLSLLSKTSLDSTAQEKVVALLRTQVVSADNDSD